MVCSEITQQHRRWLKWLTGLLFGLVVLSTAIATEADRTAASAACSPSDTLDTPALFNSNVITIGVAADLYGLIPESGWRQANAVQLAIDQTNATGGIDISGAMYTLTLVTADSACSASQAFTAAHTLLDAGVVAVVGHTCSSASLTAQAIYNEAGVAMISPSASAVALTSQGYTNTFRLAAKDVAQSTLLATYFRLSPAISRASVIERNDLWWVNDQSDAFVTAFTNHGGFITSRRYIDSTDDFTTTLTTIQAESPDVIFYADEDGSAAGLLRLVAHNLEMDNIRIGWDLHWVDEEALDVYKSMVGIIADGDYAGINARRAEDMPGYVNLNNAYKTAGFPHYGDEVMALGASAYDAAKIIIAAVDQANSTDPVLIRDAIAATSYFRGVVGTYAGFDQHGDVTPPWSWLAMYQNGTWVKIWPSKVFLPLIVNIQQ